MNEEGCLKYQNGHNPREDKGWDQGYCVLEVYAPSSSFGIYDFGLAASDVNKQHRDTDVVKKGNALAKLQVAEGAFRQGSNDMSVEWQAIMVIVVVT